MKNWKTTLFGTIAALPALLPVIGLGHFGHIGNASIDQVIGGIGALLLGAFAKDHNVTGGTVTQ